MRQGIVILRLRFGNRVNALRKKPTNNDQREPDCEYIERARRGFDDIAFRGFWPNQRHHKQDQPDDWQKPRAINDPFLHVAATL